MQPATFQRSSTIGRSLLPRLTGPIPERNRERIREALSIEAPEATVSPELAKAVDFLLKRQNVVYYGPPGTGKTYRALQVRQAWEAQNGFESVRFVTFHPSYSYEDFVIGFRPRKDDPATFGLQRGPLLETCKLAQDLLDEAAEGEDPRRVLLVIDEINRADVARVFGELITFIEPDKRGVTFGIAQDPTRSYQIPANLYFLGTMNTADKSISLLDVALRRRFAFVEFTPNPLSFMEIPSWIDNVGGIPLGSLLSSLNDRLRDEGVELDRAIGHAMLRIPTSVSDPIRELRGRFQYDIQPLVEEYCYLDRPRIARVLGALVDSDGRFNANLSDNEFIAALGGLVGSSEAGPVASAEQIEFSEDAEASVGDGEDGDGDQPGA